MCKLLQTLSYLLLSCWFSYSQATPSAIVADNKLTEQLDSLPNDHDRVLFLATFLNTQKPEDENTVAIVRSYKEKAIENEQWQPALTMVNALGNYYIYQEINHKAAYRILKSYKQYLSHNKDYKQVAGYYIAYAEAATYMQYYHESLEILNETIQYLEEKKDSSLYEYGYAYLKAGENNDKINKISESVTYFEKAKKIFTHQKNHLMYLWAQNGLAQLFSKNALYERAQEARQEVFQKGTALKEYQLVAIARLGASNDANRQGNTSEEFYHIRKALKERNNQSDIQGIVDLLTLSYAVSAYARNGITDTSNIYKKELKSKIKPHLNNPFLKTYYQLALSQNALSGGRPDEAEGLAQEALNHVKASGEVQLQIYLEKLLGNINEEKGLLKNAIQHYKNYSRIKDSVSDVTSRRKFAYVQTQFETEKKDLEIAQQKQEIQLLDAENKEKTYWFVVGALLLIGGTGFLWIYRSRHFARQQQLLNEKYSQELLISQEKERKHIARDLHDSIGQQLTLLTKKIRDLKLENLLQLSQATLDEVRTVSRGLHPPVLDSLGITEAIRQLIFAFDEKYNIIFTIDINQIDGCFTKDQDVNLYRFMQEALTNIIKHAQATEVIVEVKKKNKNIEIVIEDNGIGFDHSHVFTKQSLGLKTMKERIKILGGKLEMTTKPNIGTTIKVMIPARL
ncbi:sensor histidine kinase [Zhouia spongiae]|uniref:Sensor histidine kinase n=1 Tax=Zhouia spongiae TaxID=2202721 RepID=A0ABY3YSQ6_9FLAO|nr:sensor histidine kinase [Zhouia spongiae]UNY99783.1 sensor histidine kinase [Zhouia spongiae]